MSRVIDLLTLEVLFANKSEEYITWHSAGGITTVAHAKCFADHSLIRGVVSSGRLSYATEAEKLKRCWYCEDPLKPF